MSAEHIREEAGSPAAMDCELSLSGDEHAVLAVAGREFVGRPALDDGLRHQLRKLVLDPRAYGTALFRALLPAGGELRAGYHEALALARHEGRRLRLRLCFAPTVGREIHQLRWELLRDPRRRLAIGRSRSTTLSRYLSVPMPPGTAAVERPKALVVLSAPRDLDTYGLSEIDGSELRRAVAAAFEPPGRSSAELGRTAGGLGFSHELLEGPATALRIRDRLVRGRFQILHLVAHGGVRAGTGTAHLVLESEERRAEFVDETLLAEIVEGDRELRLVTLMACHGGQRAGADPFSGLAAALVRRGVPAVVAMCGAIRAAAAGRFTDHLYRNLARSGEIDAAVNEARQRLHLEEPEHADWSLPMLYMRLPDGLLWRPTERSADLWAADFRRRLAQARGRRDGDHLKDLEREAGSQVESDPDLASELYLSYRAVGSWQGMTGLFDRLPAVVRQLPKMRALLAFALNRQGEHRQAIWVLEELIDEVGPRPATCGLLGRVYKDLWQKARRNGRDARAQGYLDKAIATYIRGFEVDWRNAYTGINALTLLDVKGDQASLDRQAELMPVVRFGVKQRLKADQPDYWAFAIQLELAILTGDRETAERACSSALAAAEESWQCATTANNLRIIRQGRRQRDVDEPWIDEVISELTEPD